MDAFTLKGKLIELRQGHNQTRKSVASRMTVGNWMHRRSSASEDYILTKENQSSMRERIHAHHPHNPLLDTPFILKE
jgi:hypothetical protein